MLVMGRGSSQSATGTFCNGHSPRANVGCSVGIFSVNGYFWVIFRRQKHRAALPLDVTHVSRLYWPALREETFRPPELVQGWLDQYSEAYTRFKASRLLSYRVWRKNGFAQTPLDFT
jgi:hypothetical protein